MIVIIVITFILLLMFYINFLLKISRGIDKIQSNQTISENRLSVSVIIPFRNESEMIVKNLRCLEHQNYPIDRYEVIYIDDGSNDDSLPKLESSISRNNISIQSIVNIDYERAHKKHAIEFGITKAKGEIIILTDADCLNEPTWISSMIDEFTNDTGLVSGPVKFISNNKLFEKLQQLEFAGLILSGAGLIGNKTPIICSSANLAFRKSIFKEVNGYRGLMGFSSGDDELLMQKIAQDTDYEVKFCFHSNALVTTKPNRDLKEFTQQRKRWASKGFFYKNKSIVALLLLILHFYTGLIAQILLGIFFERIFLYTIIISFLAKIMMEYSVMKKGVGILLDKIPIGIFLLAELLHVPYIIYASVAGTFGNFTWKERKLKR